MLIDSHAHITEQVEGVDYVINIGTDLEDSQKAINLAQKYKNIYATVGIHPEFAGKNIDWEIFEKLTQQPKVVGIGECGLDYHNGYDPLQKPLFEKQLEIARKYNLPLTIHIRDAWEEIKKIDLSKNRGVFHCYSGPMEIPDNFFVSFAGNLTFKNAKDLQETAKKIPLDKIILETDSPYLSPEPFRGQQNRPANVKIIAEKIAELKSIPFEEVAKITSQNAIKLYSL